MWLFSVGGSVIFVLSILMAPLAAEAQQATKVYRIGIFLAGPVSPRLHFVEAFRQGLLELGYVEGQNFAIVIRSAEQGPEQLPDLAVELVRLKVDMIVTGGPLPAQAAQQATRTIPIVMAGHPDPVKAGFVVSLARPGGNVTGLTVTSRLGDIRKTAGDPQGGRSQGLLRIDTLNRKLLENQWQKV